MDTTLKPVEVKLVSFECSDNLKQYTDSMLFDSGECIASGVFEVNGKEFSIDLEVCGEVAVNFKGEVYHRPSEFPDELIERIKSRPNDWMYYSPSGEGNDDEEGNVYVGMNNWFEYLMSNGDGDVFEEDLAEATSEKILEDMIYLANQYRYSYA